MTENAILQVLFYLIVLTLLVKPLGHYMALIYEGKWQIPFFRGIENAFYRYSGIDAAEEMDWKQYVFAMLVFNALGMLFMYCIQRLQVFLPLNPQHFSGITPELAFNTAASFVSNTDWQAYAAESTMSYFTDMFAFTVQNFVSAATGMALLIALIRGLVRHETKNIGNFWADMLRSVLYILLPLSIILSILLVSQGVIQNLKPYQTVPLLEKTSYTQSTTNPLGKTINTTVPLTTQQLPMGPAASQIAIKQLGTNGGGFFNANSATPFENPTPFSNFLEMLAILLIPAALCYTFGSMVGETKQGWTIFSAMMIIFIPCIFISMHAEQKIPPTLSHFNIATQKNHGFIIGNMEGKETRFGITNSMLWANATTAGSNGAVNASMDSLTPIGSLLPIWLMQLGEVIFGGAGAGLYGMLMLAIVTVFIAGLMVGRTPEYLGKKIEPFEMKMAAIYILLMPLLVLVGTAFGVISTASTAATANPGPHGFTEILYAFTSMVNTNGSAFAGLNSNISFYNDLGGFFILMGRYWIAIPALALAGSLVQKRKIPVTAGTLPTDSFLFMVLLVAIVLIVGALTFFPALALGPIAEQLTSFISS